MLGENDEDMPPADDTLKSPYQALVDKCDQFEMLYTAAARRADAAERAANSARLVLEVALAVNRASDASTATQLSEAKSALKKNSALERELQDLHKALEQAKTRAADGEVDDGWVYVGSC